MFWASSAKGGDLDETKDGFAHHLDFMGGNKDTESLSRKVIGLEHPTNGPVNRGSMNLACSGVLAELS
ncbi:hypothetical protein CEXT_482651 [Caerostris extrusa]|uniref:Uncharacterized protein n=1 Tax=Caerostris extrusa TaxID=172846 RepID=A0AAV4WI75_CAEEX|nr:hypothetical protein CEXT_482651 [Caerostris extrusa]